MPVSRYSRDPVFGVNEFFGTARATQKIRAAMRSGELVAEQRILRDGERLDTIAGKEYGDGRYWWIIAAASDVGWGLQVPPGTLIVIPNLDKVLEIVTSS